MAKEKLKVGLALGGGGARGLAHIGVLKVLERENIPIDLITGTSMGAIIGGEYALKKDISAIEKIAEKYSKISEFNIDFSFSEKERKDKPFFLKKMSDFLKKGYILNLELRRKYIDEGEGIKKIIKDLVGDKAFTDTKIPFAAVAADLVKGEKVILNQGKLFDALLASSSIPGMFPPVILDKKILVDGGIVDVVPIQAAQSLGANFVIGVNVGQNIILELKKKLKKAKPIWWKKLFY